jgi:hypothetical protein
VVVHAVNPIYTRWDAELLPLFRQGLAVAEALGARFMLPGNVYNYGSGMPALLDEDTAAARHAQGPNCAWRWKTSCSAAPRPGWTAW